MKPNIKLLAGALAAVAFLLTALAALINSATTTIEANLAAGLI